MVRLKDFEIIIQEYEKNNTREPNLFIINKCNKDCLKSELIALVTGLNWFIDVNINDFRYKGIDIVWSENTDENKIICAYGVKYENN